jgi:2-oxoglutarate ferredoxin oxidoreductase subunit delta
MKKKAKGRIVIDRERCKGCRYCLSACPNGSITIEEKFNSMGYYPARFTPTAQCTGCTRCARMCPDIAIEVWREK